VGGGGRVACRGATTMEVEWYANRAALRVALGAHPGASAPRLARELGRSVSWVKKWRRRLGQAPPDDEAVLRSRSRAPGAGPRRSRRR
jgi:transposase-like protein